jgi:hypothetical protein
VITQQPHETDAHFAARLNAVEQNRAHLMNRVMDNHGPDAAARAIVALLAPRRVVS